MAEIKTCHGCRYIELSESGKPKCMKTEGYFHGFACNFYEKRDDMSEETKKCGDCEHYEPDDRYCGISHTTMPFGAETDSAACKFYANAKEISDILREAETVPVVAEQDEPEQNEPTSPNHYKHGGIECKDCIKAALGENYIGFLIGNVIKYVYRYKHKNGVNDLEKAKVYLEWAIKEVANEE